MGRYKCMAVYGLLVLAILFSSGCKSNTRVQQEDMLLKVGLMPAVDSAPVLLAEKNGYFKELGLNVELEIYNNAQNRQSALQAQSIDGAMTDLIAVATNVDSGFDIKATTMTNGVFPVLSRKGSEDKESIKVGMMEVSVSNFLIDEWLGGIYTIEKVFINEIPARLAAIESGQLDMGLFPEPVASMGVLNGLEKNVYNTEDPYCPDVMVFTGKAIKEKEKAVELFHKAYNMAVAEININEQLARDILMEKMTNLEPGVRDLMVLPRYTKASLPDNRYIEKIIEWTSGVLHKDLKVDAEDLVERKFAE
ncbi:MAG: ABC transporter substrate-binding protein [Acetivibrionales bacterium]